MQQNARHIYQRAFRIALPNLGILRSSKEHPHHFQRFQIQHRWFSREPTKRAFLGSLDLGDLGGSHYFRVEVPDGERQKDEAAWIAAMDTCLPRHLRMQAGVARDEPTGKGNITSRDVCLLLIEAQSIASFDLLGHLGMVQGRWNAVMWIVNLVAEAGLPMDIWSSPQLAAISLDNPKKLPLESLLQNPLNTTELAKSQPTSVSLERTIMVADARLYDRRLQRGGLGQIWYTLGSMAIASAENDEDAQRLMPHVLTILATLHHHDIVPQSTYRYESPRDDWSVYQPPLLYALADDIVSSLTEAAWNARESAQSAEENGNGATKSFFGLQSPQTPKPQKLRPEVWLELILWSCLHGPWVDEGARLLERIANKKLDTSWSLICWKALQAKLPAQTASFGWNDALNMLQGIPLGLAHPAIVEKLPVARTVSSELVCAYVDALLSRIHVGVGKRGISLQRVLTTIKRLKTMLGQQNLGLGFATWDVVVQRFFESGGILIEREPDLALEVLQLAEPYGKELEASNVPSISNSTTTVSPYFFSANAFALGILHRCLYVQCQRGSIEGALRTLKALQDFTELNQRRSIEQFFHDLKQQAGHTPQQFRFSNNLSAAEYPGFFMQVPIYVLNSLLDVAVDLPDPRFQDWILHSKDVDGPLVPESLYSEVGLAPVLVRFATATDKKGLLENVMTRYSQLNENDRAIIPANLSNALMHTLIEQRRWDSIGRIIESGLPGSGYNTWNASVFPAFTSELLKLEAESKAQPDKVPIFAHATTLLEAMAQKYSETKQHRAEPNLLHTQLALLASVDERWARFCSDLLILPRRSFRLNLYPRSFTAVLQAVLETRGFAAARKYWETWCLTSSQLHKSLGAGGLIRVPRKRPPLQPSFAAAEDRVLISHQHTISVEIVPKVLPNLSDVRLLLKGLQQMETTRLGDGDSDLEHHALLEDARLWVAKYISILVLSKDLGEMSLAQLVDAVEEVEVY